MAQDHQESIRAEIDEINAAIAREGAEWVAGETSVLRLSHAERQSRLGFIPSDIPEEKYIVQDFAPMAAPSHLDWRNNSGNYVTPIRDQRSCGSCWAFATTAALESATLITLGTPGVDINLAEQILVSCSGAGSCGGGYTSYASDYFQDTGLPLESCYPYTGTNGNCGNACSNWQSSTYKIVRLVGRNKIRRCAEKRSLYVWPPRHDDAGLFGFRFLHKAVSIPMSLDISGADMRFSSLATMTLGSISSARTAGGRGGESLDISESLIRSSIVL